MPLFFSFGDSFIFWVIMEINLMLFILMASTSNLSWMALKSFNLLYYFMIQCLGSFMFLFVVSTNCMWTVGFSQNFVFITVALLKLGLFPFHFWMFTFCYYANFLELFFILTLQKIPFTFFLFRMSWDLLMVFIVFSLMFGAYMVFYSKSMTELLVSSSVYISFWLLGMVWTSTSLFFFFFFFYSSYNLSLCKASFLSMKEFMFSCHFLPSCLSVLFLMGLPPLSFFFFKFYNFHLITNFIPSFLFLLLWTFTFGAMMGYFKFFYKIFFMYYDLVKNLKNFYSSGTILLFSFILFVYF